MFAVGATVPLLPFLLTCAARRRWRPRPGSPARVLAAVGGFVGFLSGTSALALGGADGGAGGRSRPASPTLVGRLFGAAVT